MIRLTLLMSALLWLSACASIKDSAREYFHQGDHVKGVEPADSLIERMRKDQQLRDIMYGHLKSSKILQCTLLRNQLYVASMKGSRDQEIIEAVKIMEPAYQENDAAFLSACDQIMSMRVGKV